MTVDAHHHLWDPAERRYPWMTESLSPIRRRFGLDELGDVTSRAGVTGTVVVQAVSDPDETRDLLRLASLSQGLIRGVIGWVDLSIPGVSDRLEMCWEEPDGHRLVGIRHQVHDEPDPDWLRRSGVRQGLHDLERAGLPFDLLIRDRELPAALDTVRDFADLRFVVNHCAKPAIATGAWQPWADGIASLARCENTVCKLSGLVTEADWRRWRPGQLRRYSGHVLDCFGPNRVMFGSDWPVCLLAAEYAEVVEVAQQACDEFNGDERDAVFGGTAERTYSLAT